MQKKSYLRITKATFTKMNRYFIELSYNGTNYCGWQIQPNSRTIQAEINKALTLFLHEEINVVGAGRTDTGVHASHFMAHFETNQSITDTNQMVYKLNRMLDRDIAIKRIFLVSNDTHARFSATSRTYKYFIDKTKDPFTYAFSYKIHPIPDIKKMNEACKLLFNYKDFTSFSKLHTDAKTNNCTIMEALWTETENQIIFTIKADRFLRNMVRAIVGTMLDIGIGKLSLDDFTNIIEQKNRNKAGMSVPGNALFLCKIEYPQGFDKINNNITNS